MKVLNQAIGERYALYQGDSAEVLAGLPDGCVDLSVYSPPFSSLFTYTASDRDLGNCRGEQEFFAHYSYIIGQVLRLTKPGRLTAVHVAQVPAMLSRDGYIGLKDFRGDVIRAYVAAGWIYHGEVCIDKDPQCLIDGTSVLTPAGWRPIETLQVGDLVIGSDGRPTEVIDVPYRGMQPVYQVEFDDGQAVRCGPEHLWAVRIGSGPWRTLRTDQIDPITPSGKYRYEIPISAPIHFGRQNTLPIHPRLLGALLADGNWAGQRAVSITKDHELVESLPLPPGHYLSERPGSDRAGGRTATYGIACDEWHRNDVLAGLRELGLGECRAWEKFIPESYLFGSIETRQELLRGLLDGDGKIRPNGGIYYLTTSRNLAEGIRHLVCSLGGLTSVAVENRGDSGHHELFTVSIRLAGDWCPFTLGRKARHWRPDRRAVRRHIVKVAQTGEVAPATCISVAASDGLYVAENFVVTHNSQAIRTKSKALLFVQLHKDSSWSRPALADYILLFRRPGENATPVNPDLTNDEWIEWARPIWYGIKETDTLNFTEARSQEDERHICLARGSLVLTRDRGYIPIEEISVGDNVLTHKGRWMPVTAKRCNGMQPIIRICAQGVADLRVTPDHQLWTRQVLGDTYHAKKSACQSEPAWIPAAETLGGYLNLQLPPTEEDSLTKDEWWIVGRYLGDGNRGGRQRSGVRNGKGQFLITCSYEETPKLVERLGRYAGQMIDTGTAKQIGLRDLRAEVRDVLYRCGRGAAQKRLPGEAVTLIPEKAESLLAGYLSADGHYVARHDRWCASSISRALLLGMAMVAQRARGVVASVYAGRPERDGEIEGRAVHMRQDWVFTFRNSLGRHQSGWVQNDGAWKKVRKIEDVDAAEVWDIQVLGDASFAAEGCIVHNCPLQLGTIERCVRLWSNPDEIVLSPFAGIGSECYVAVKQGRRAVGMELKAEYFKVATANLEEAERVIRSGNLFSWAGMDEHRNGHQEAP